MDKETLSNYGWIVILVLILAVMLALATPFGTFIADGIKSTTQGLFDVNYSALNSTGLINIGNQSFDTESIPPAEAPTEPEPIVIKAVRNERTLQEYDTVSEAIEEAEEGDIIKLYKDVVETEMVIAVEHTIDLNGNNLSAPIILFGDFKDSKDGKGSASATSGMAYVNESIKEYIPIYNEKTNAYHFFKFSLENLGVEQELIDGVWKAHFSVRVNFENKEAHTMLKTSPDLRLSFYNECYTSNGGVSYTASEFLKNLDEDNVITVTSKKHSSVNTGDEVKYYFQLSTESDAVGISNKYTYKTQEYTFIAK